MSGILTTHATVLDRAETGDTITVRFDYSDGTTFTTTYLVDPGWDDAAIEVFIRDQIRGPNGEQKQTIVAQADDAPPAAPPDVAALIEPAVAQGGSA